MSDLTIIPSVEQINLEYRLAQNKASEAVQHAINCGLMLLQVKASLAHGQWLPWLEDQRKSGSLEFSQPTASKYMKIASNYNRGFNLTESPSIRAALELLTEDKPSSEPQPGLELETAQERKAREAAEAKAKAAEARASQAEQRGEEWRQQSITEKKKREEAERAAALKASELRILQQSVDAAAESIANAKLASIRTEVEQAKIDKLELEQKLKQLRKDQDAAVETRTRQALQAQQDEINRREQQLSALEGRISVLNARLDAANQQDRAVSHFTEVTKEIRRTLDALSLHLTTAFDADYASFLPAPFVPVFERLAHELDQGAASVRAVLGQADIRPIEVAVHAE